MTKKEALQILFYHAGQNVRGVGQGIRTLPPPQEKVRVQQAIRRLFKDAYKRDPYDSDIFNLA